MLANPSLLIKKQSRTLMALKNFKGYILKARKQKLLSLKK